MYAVVFDRCNAEFHIFNRTDAYVVTCIFQLSYVQFDSKVFMNDGARIVFVQNHTVQACVTVLLFSYGSDLNQIQAIKNQTGLFMNNNRQAKGNNDYNNTTSTKKNTNTST